MMTPELAGALAKEIAAFAICGRGQQFHIAFAFDDESPENLDAFKKFYTEFFNHPSEWPERGENPE